MTARRPYQLGDLVAVWHTCTHHAPALSNLQITSIVKVTDGHRRPVGQRWRLTARRCDGSMLEVQVDGKGRDDEGYVAPRGTKPPLATTTTLRDPLHGAKQLDVFELLAQDRGGAA